ncbi:protoporphyrinogen/coproporphyrinogen oxidase [Marisediminicola senii]|uniref:protoporphyrinogen/coproporphyrinogen oxidase n=1 Tax=Marisediminicola senii TaxID=2711233 RepID=UPI0013EB0D65|nr:FAD-dependent oxidoreductase [Marisediminicola senii]
MVDPVAAAPPSSGQHPARHVIVVGGGVAGLVMSMDLLDAGVRVTLVEASTRLGGKVRDHEVGGVRLDAGAESFATRGGTVAALVRELGLGPALVTPKPGGAWLQPRDGAAVPLPAAGLLGIPSAPLARDVIAVVGLRGALRARLDAVLPASIGAGETSFGGLVRARMGSAVVEKLVMPVATAIHSTHPDDLDVDVVAPRLRAALRTHGSLARAVLTLRAAAPAGSAVQGLEGGVHQIAGALAARVADRATVLLGRAVLAADAASITLDDGTRLEADAVVVAAELGAATGLPITLATLVVDDRALDAAPRGSGVIVAPGARGIRAKAITHATVKWSWLAADADGAHVLRLSYETAPPSDDELREVARHDAERLLGVPIDPAAVRAFDRVTWTGPPIAGALSTPGGPVQIGERVSGTGLAAVIGHTRRESDSLLKFLG